VGVRSHVSNGGAVGVTWIIGVTLIYGICRRLALSHFALKFRGVLSIGPVRLSPLLGFLSSSPWRNVEMHKAAAVRQRISLARDLAFEYMLKWFILGGIVFESIISWFWLICGEVSNFRGLFESEGD